MASERFVLAATTADALADAEIRKVTAPSVVNLWASGTTKGNTVGLRLGNTVIREASNINVELSADVIDIARDQILFNHVVGRGTLRMPVPALTTETQVEISVEPII